MLNYLGANEEAYGVHQDNVLRHRRVLGPNHPDTIASEYNMGPFTVAATRGRSKLPSRVAR
ncbi:hypothetical protein [Streptomyces coeruleorubidus]